MSPISFGERLTAEAVCAALAAAGLSVRPSDVRVEQREERWVARLPGERIAWFVASADARARLAVERRVLNPLEARCGFAAPRVLYESPAGDFDVRRIVPGCADPSRLYARVRRDPAAAARVGAGVGAMLAEQHSTIAAADVAGWLPARASWPEPGEWIAERLPSVVADPELRARAAAVVAAYEEEPVAADDRVLVHTDLGLHNLAVAPRSFTVRGLFD